MSAAVTSQMLCRDDRAILSVHPLVHCKAAAALIQASSNAAYATTIPGPAAAANNAPTVSLSSSSSSKSTRSRRWIASLTIGGMLTGLVASNLEKAPVTGRTRLVFDMYKMSLPSVHGQPAMPAVIHEYSGYAYNMPMQSCRGLGMNCWRAPTRE